MTVFFKQLGTKYAQIVFKNSLSIIYFGFWGDFFRKNAPKGAKYVTIHSNSTAISQTRCCAPLLPLRGGLFDVREVSASQKRYRFAARILRASTTIRSVNLYRL